MNVKDWSQNVQKNRTSTTTTTKGEIPNEYAHLTTKSSIIRKMYEDGFNISSIANALEIRYQHVRNVVKNPTKK